MTAVIVASSTKVVKNMRQMDAFINLYAHKMLKNKHFGAGSDAMQQVHGSVKSNIVTLKLKIYQIIH